MKDNPLTVYVVLRVEENYECIDSIHDSEESSERRKKYLVGLGFPPGAVQIEDFLVSSLSQLSS